MNDFMNSEELKRYLDIINEGNRRFQKALAPLAEKLCELYDTSREEEIKPTLSEILTEGSKRIDDAVQSVIARHEKEIAYDEAVKQETKRAIDQVGRSQYDIRATHTATKTWLLQQMGADRRNLMNQFQGGNWI
jgi:hypothetical protein